MFFVLSKTLGVLAVPSQALTILAGIGAALLLTRWRRAGRRVLWLCMALFFALGMLPVGRTLIVVLESRFPAWTETATAPDGIIILGGPINLRASLQRGTVELDESAERLTAIPALARRYPQARIVFSGGNASLIADYPPEARFAVTLLESFGIARDRILVEERSRNTAENASFTKTLVDPKPGERWLLVTSAAHMPRAVGTFRRVGFAIEPYPVDWQTSVVRGDWWWRLRPTLWPLRGWNALDRAAKEWIGLIVYWMTGRTSELFPGP